MVLYSRNPVDTFSDVALYRLLKFYRSLQLYDLDPKYGEIILLRSILRSSLDSSPSRLRLFFSVALPLTDSCVVASRIVLSP